MHENNYVDQNMDILDNVFGKKVPWWLLMILITKKSQPRASSPIS